MTLVSAHFILIGADTYWAVALGRTIAAARSIPDGIPFAAAPSSGWPNVPVLAELLLAALAAPGPIGIVVAQLVADAAALLLLATGAVRRGAGDAATAGAVALVSLGALPALASVKLQLFSLALFPALLLVLRRDHEHPGRVVWIVVPLIALWGNLHGAVLLGVAVTGAYLLFSRLRLRPGETVLVGGLSLLAVFANPALGRTVTYYAGVLGNEAARRGTELWARPNPGSLFDLLLIVTGVVLVVAALASRPAWWEVVAILGLAVATATSARHGVWLLMLCAAPAARRLTRHATSPPSRTRHRWTPVVATVIAVVGGAILVTTRSEALNPSGSPGLVDAVKVAAAGRTVLADEPVAESLAAEGVRVWLSNPIDAFSRTDQAAYLDFVSGVRGPALDAAPVVVVRGGGNADTMLAADSRFGPPRSVEGWSIYTRVG